MYMSCMYCTCMYMSCMYTHSLVMIVDDGPLSVHVREAQVSQLQIVCDGLQTHLRAELDRMREREGRYSHKFP